MTNPLVDDQRLTDLQDRLHRLALEKAAIASQHDTLEATRRELMQRGEEYRRAMLARLSGQLAATKMASRPGLAEGQQANANMHRKSDLARSGDSLGRIWTESHYARVAGPAGPLAGQSARRLCRPNSRPQATA